MNSSTAVCPKFHYHIHWLVLRKLDWERHETRALAEKAAHELSRRDERYAVVRFDETCVKCATLGRDAST